MAVTFKWRQHIKNWQSSGLSQAEYCVQQGINTRTFSARLCDYRKRPVTESVELVPVQMAPAEPASAVTPALAASIVFLHAQGHRLELSSSVPAAWVAELLRCMA